MILTDQTRRLHLVLCTPAQPKVQQLRPEATSEDAMQCALSQIDAALNTIAAIGLSKPELLQYRAEALQDIAERFRIIVSVKRPGLLSRWFVNASRAP